MTDLPWASILGWLSLLGLVSLVASLLFLPWVLARLPVNYFVRPERPPPRGPLTQLLRLVRNLVGVLLILAGLVMLILPGQGLLTLLIGLILTDLPGKRRWEGRLLRRPGLARALAWMRRKTGRSPFQLPAQD